MGFLCLALLLVAIHLRLGEKLPENLTFRQAHNLKVVGSNPTPATNKYHIITINYSLHF